MEEMKIAIPIIFLAGLLSFFSVCVLPIIPGFVARIAGVSFDEVVSQESVRIVRRKTFLAGIGFSSGFFIVAVLLFGGISSLISLVPENIKNVLRIVGGILIILIALSYFGLYNILPLMKEKRVVLSKNITNKVSFFTSMLVGGAFVLGWSPCLGVQISAVIMMAGLGETSMLSSWMYLAVYSLGLILPFLGITLCFGWFVKFLPKLNKKIKYFEWFSGLLLIIMGIMLLLNKMQPISIGVF